MVCVSVTMGVGACGVTLGLVGWGRVVNSRDGVTRGEYGVLTREGLLTRGVNPGWCGCCSVRE